MWVMPTWQDTFSLTVMDLWLISPLLTNCSTAVLQIAASSFTRGQDLSIHSKLKESHQILMSPPSFYFFCWDFEICFWGTVLVFFSLRSFFLFLPLFLPIFPSFTFQIPSFGMAWKTKKQESKKKPLENRNTEKQKYFNLGK